MGWLHQACFVFVFGYSLFGPTVTLMPSAGALALCMTAACYIALDVRIEWKQIHFMSTIVVISVYLLLLGFFLGMADRTNPDFAHDITTFYSVFGLNSLAICLGGALWEEVIFRRHLVRQLQRFMPLSAAMVTSSVTFMFAHGAFMPSLFVAGLCYCLLTYKLNCFHAAVVLHTLHNFVGIASSAMQKKPAELNSSTLMHATTGLTSLAFTVLLLVFLATRALINRSPPKN